MVMVGVFISLLSKEQSRDTVMVVVFPSSFLVWAAQNGSRWVDPPLFSASKLNLRFWSHLGCLFLTSQSVFAVGDLPLADPRLGALGVRHLRAHGGAAGARTHRGDGAERGAGGWGGSSSVCVCVCVCACVFFGGEGGWTIFIYLSIMYIYIHTHICTSI